MWKGVIRFGDESLPVKLYSAVQDQGVHFRLLHEKDLQPIKQEMVHPNTGKVVARDRVRRGFEVERGVFVVLEDEDLAALEPEASRDIEITRFVPDERITHQWYDRPYYLGPDGEKGTYFALAQALSRRGVAGVARWVMRKKPYVGALRAEGPHLMLITLRTAQEVVPASALEAPGGRKLDDREVRMARQLISALEDAFDPADYRDEFRDRVLELVQAKAKGEPVSLPEPVERKAAGRSLADMLEKSVKSAKGARSGKRTKREKAVA
jgi:DNA end-binding protein Ku